MAYILENKDEASRLERQARARAYNVDEEFEDWVIPSRARVLDAGCGSGLVARHLASRFKDARIEACDASEIRLHEARALARQPEHHRIHFFHADLARGVEQGAYDAIACRFVLEHLADPAPAVAGIFRALRSGGVARVVDIDGLLFNLHPVSPELGEMLSVLKRSLPLDLEVGRKIPALLERAGFEQIVYRVEAFGFQGEELESERRMTAERLGFARQGLALALGSPERAQEFIDRYLEEMGAPGAALFYNKFVVTGRKR